MTGTRCSIEGCSSETSRTGAPYICAVHWRRHCPPRSLRRRAYHRFFARAKREGWTDQTAAQFRRFWETLVRVANAAERNDRLDMTEINKLFGWTE